MTRSTAVSRPAVLQAAGALFAERGYHGTSMRDIGAALTVQAPGLYNHVESKQDILLAIMEQAMDRALVALDDALSGVETVDSQLRVATESLVLDFLRYPDETTVCNTEIRALHEPARSTIIGKRDRYGERVRAIIENGCATGAFATGSPRLASYAVLEMGNSAKAWFRPSGPVSDVEVARVYGDFALGIVGAV